MSEAQTILDLQRAKRDEIVRDANAAIELAAKEERALTPEETELVQRAAKESAEIDEAIASTVQIVRGNAAASVDLRKIPTQYGGAVVRSEPMTYEKHGRDSYFRDLALRSVGRGDRGTQERLERHAREMEVEARANSTSDGAGGEFVPPIWLMNEYVEYFRAGRVTANFARSLPLPSGTDSISVPAITTGALVAKQATENSAVTTRDLVTSSTTAEVTTIAGYVDTSLQLVEQSAMAAGLDSLIFADLIADRNRQTDVFVLSGSGTSNEPVGLITAAFTSVTVSAAAATALYGGLGDALNRVATNRYDMPQVILMHPRRWFWMSTRYDTNGRPLVVPDAQGAQNVLAAMGMPKAEGVVGTMLGLPVAIDPNISTTTSTYFDDVIVWRASDAILMEGAPRLEAFREPLSSTLGIRFRLYNYAAFSTRTSKSVAYLTGAGLTGPTF